MKLSQWHKGTVKPVRVGIYEGFCNSRNKSYFSWWDGEVFKGWWFTIERAYQHRDSSHSYRLDLWRGIVK